jgi:peroxiredoxin Q/BCP
MPKLKANDTVVLGVSRDSPAANAAFAKQIGVTFPLLSDMNARVMERYGILQKTSIKGVPFEWARRTTFVIDKEGIIRHIQQGNTAINPNDAVAVCLDLNRGQKKSK